MVAEDQLEQIRDAIRQLQQWNVFHRMMHNNEREVHAGFFFCVCRYFSPMSSLGAKKNAEPVT